MVRKTTFKIFIGYDIGCGVWKHRFEQSGLFIGYIYNVGCRMWKHDFGPWENDGEKSPWQH